MCVWVWIHGRKVHNLEYVIESESVCVRVHDEAFVTLILR